MAPYISNNKIKTTKDQFFLLSLKRFPTQVENLKQIEVNRLLELYTTTGFLTEYEKTGQFALPYSVDDPLTPALEVINNTEYHYYQKLI